MTPKPTPFPKQSAVGFALTALLAVTMLVILSACSAIAEDNTRAVQTYGADSAAATTATALAAKPAVDETSATSAPPSSDAATDVSEIRPSWLGTRTLPTTADGHVVPQTTPIELQDRRLPTLDTLPPPLAGEPFQWASAPLDDKTLQRTTWIEGCPVGPDELLYLTMSFWGFDDRPHTGEMIVNRAVADDIVSVFGALFNARYPIEEMRLVTKADLDAPPTGDGNNTGSFVCRAVTGGSKFSQHAYGLAIDINPFLNPYERGELVLPELATLYLDRSVSNPGVISDGDVVVEAFDEIGWHWGGRWTTLKDYQHFSLNNR